MASDVLPRSPRPPRRRRRRRRLYRAGVRRLTDGWASRSTDDGAAPPGYTQAIRLSLDGSWWSPARLRAGGDHVTVRRRRERGASSRDAGDKLSASGRPLAGRELVAAGQATDGRPTVLSALLSRRRTLTSSSKQ